ncbi:MAG TPA: hypothetical protein VLK03_15040 [Nocardioides sp.]|nr:hypothetical protein [Nocardioides sp.]
MSRAPRVVSVLLRLLGGVLALVVLVYLVVNAVMTVQAQQRRGEVADRVSARLEQALPASADRQQDLLALVDSEPDARWVEQHCDFSSDDAGWMVQAYRQTCSVRGLVAWQVESAREAEDLLAVEGQEEAAYDGCRRLGTVDDAEAYAVDASAAEGEPWCSGAAAGSSRDLVGERVALDPGQWLLLVDEQPLVDEPIGCVRWSVLFCDNPFGDRPAFGEAPAS